MADLLATARDSVGFGSPGHLVFVPISVMLLVVALGLCLTRLASRPPRTLGSTYSLLGQMTLWLAVVFALALTALAAARPFFLSGGSSFKWNAIDVAFVVDVSSSMWVQDVRPSRLEVAVREVLDLTADEIVREGDRAALFVFGTTAIRKAHLSPNLDRFVNIVANLKRPKTLIGDAFPWHSDAASAFEHIYQSLDNQDRLQAGDPAWKPVRRTDRAIVLLTDGDFAPAPEQAQRLDVALVELQRRGVKIYPIGIGTAYGAPLRDILRGYSARDYDETIEADLADQQTRLDRAMLSYVARRTGGKEFIVGDETVRASEFLLDALNSHRSVGLQFVSRSVREDAWQYLVIAAIVVIAGGWWISGLRRAVRIFTARSVRRAAGSVAPLRTQPW